MKKYVIILACGLGARMQSSTPKQYIELNGKPIIFHTIERIWNFDHTYNIIVVINKEHTDLFTQLKNRYALTVPFSLVFGGAERFYSVKNALDTITDEYSLVAIHDGVRPVVEKQMFEQGFCVAATLGNAICAIKATDSIRLGNEHTNESIDRSKVFLVQTPQIFKTSVIKKAYSQPFQPTFTDDASVAQNIGENINIIEGSKTNIKITYTSDLAIAQHFLNNTQ